MTRTLTVDSKNDLFIGADGALSVPSGIEEGPDSIGQDNG